MPYTTSELIQRIIAAANRYGINPNIAVAQLRRESVNFKPYYVYGPGRSPAGAQGLAQFIPGTWARYGSGSPFNPDNALEAWGKYMTHLLSIFGRRYDLALAGYNWGENRQTLRNALASGRSILTYSIPAETRGYVSNIMSAAGSPIVTPPPVITPPPTPPPGGGWNNYTPPSGIEGSVPTINIGGNIIRLDSQTLLLAGVLLIVIVAG